MPQERYKNASVSKRSGAIYTPTAMARALSYEMLSAYGDPLPKSISVLDPAVGEAELLLNFVDIVKEKSPQTSVSVVGYDVNEDVCEIARKNLRRRFDDVIIDIRNEDFWLFYKIGHGHDGPSCWIAA